MFKTSPIVCMNQSAFWLSPCDHADSGDGVEGAEPEAQLPGPGHLHGHQPLSHLVLQLNLPFQRHPVHLGNELLLPLLRAVGRRGRLFAARLPHVSVCGRPLSSQYTNRWGQTVECRRKNSVCVGLSLGLFSLREDDTPTWAPEPEASTEICKADRSAQTCGGDKRN